MALWPSIRNQRPHAKSPNYKQRFPTSVLTVTMISGVTSCGQCSVQVGYALKTWQLFGAELHPSDSMMMRSGQWLIRLFQITQVGFLSAQSTTTLGWGVGMTNGATLPSSTPLQLLQVAFCLIKLGGEIWIVDRDDVTLVLTGQKPGNVYFYKRPAGEMLMRRFLENLSVNCDTKKTINDFWVNPCTHVYTDIAFNPLPQPATTLNYWVGNLISPTRGNWSIIGHHLLYVICAGDLAVYEYVTKYLAHMFQCPEHKPGVMLVLLGKQGTGKGLFFQILQRIWSRTSLLVSDIDQIVGRFNAALEHNYVIIMDEAMFSGDRKSQDRMKSLITEKTCHVEQKYQPSRTITSVHRFFASSNQQHFSHVEADDRRSLFLRVSDTHLGDTAYFEKLLKAIDDDRVIAAMVYALTNLNLTGFDVRARPLTHEHGEQKLKSLQGFDRYWYEVLVRGRFDICFIHYQWPADNFISTDQIIKGYQESDKHSQKFATTQSREIANAIKRLCPSAKKDRRTILNAQQRGHVMPDLATARKEFDNAYNFSTDWDDGGTE